MTPRQVKKTFDYGTPLAAIALVGVFGTAIYIAEKSGSEQIKKTQISREANPLEEAVCDALIVKGRAEKGFTVAGAMEKQNVFSQPTSQEDYTQSNLSTNVYNDLFARLNPGKNTRVITIGEEYNFPIFDKNAKTLNVYKLKDVKPVDQITAYQFARSPAGNCKLRLESLDTYKQQGEK